MKIRKTLKFAVVIIMTSIMGMVAGALGLAAVTGISFWLIANATTTVGETIFGIISYFAYTIVLVAVAYKSLEHIDKMYYKIYFFSALT